MDTGSVKLRIGILAIQGAFIEHNNMLARAAKQLGTHVHVVDVKEPYQLRDLVGLVIPGGESTTMSLFLGQNGFAESLKSWAKGGIIMGTCAGLILLSNQLEGQKEGGQALVS